MQAKRIMHVIFYRKYHNQEQMAAVLINPQINNHPVVVCVRSDCDAYDIRSLLNYLHPRVEFFRIPVSFSFAYLLYFLMIWHPTLLRWHNLRIRKTLSLVFWRLPQISNLHASHNRPHKRIHRKTLKIPKSKPTFNQTTEKKEKVPGDGRYEWSTALIRRMLFFFYDI